MISAFDLATAVTRHLTDTNSIAYAHLDPNLHVSQVSENFAQGFVTATTKQVVGAPISELLWEFVGAEEALQDVMQGHLPAFRVDQVRRETAEDAGRYLSFLVIPFEAGNPSAGLLLIVEDTTSTGVMEQRLVQERNELRLAQIRLSQANAELQRLNRLKTLFLSIAAHDLRTPLTVIKGFSELLLNNLQREDNPKQHDYLVTIASQSEWLDRLITDFLSLNQIEEGKLSLQLKAIHLQQIVDELQEGIENLASTKGLTFSVEPAAAPTAVYVDPERVKQILYNLLGNAVKYTPQGGEIHLRYRSEDGMAVLEVADTGRGMTREQQSQLFKPYYRTDEARRSRTQGAGMGLYIVKTLVEAMHGRIAVTSTHGAGTTFTVWLPAHAPAEA